MRRPDQGLAATLGGVVRDVGRPLWLLGVAALMCAWVVWLVLWGTARERK